MTGIELISQERQEQLTKHYRTVEQDKIENNEYQLIDAVAALIIPVPDDMKQAYIDAFKDEAPIGWNKEIWLNMISKPYKERLVIAAALTAAEIDRVS